MKTLRGFTRLDVIDATGRAYTRWGVDIAISVQDEGRTLKLFLTDNADAPKEPPPGWLGKLTGWRLK